MLNKIEEIKTVYLMIYDKCMFYCYFFTRSNPIGADCEIDFIAYYSLIY